MLKRFFGLEKSPDSKEIPAWRDASPGYANRARLSCLFLAIIIGILFYLFGDGGLTEFISPALIGLLVGTCLYQAWERGALQDH